MTENKAKEYMENEVECIKKASHCDRDCLNCELVKEETPLIESYGMAIKALEEIQQYRAIGTIEEFKALKEKNTPKKVNIQQWIYTKCECGYEFSKHHGDGYYSIPYEKQTKHCPDCGQKLDWQ